jgi:hypothetical protein
MLQYPALTYDAYAFPQIKFPHVSEHTGKKSIKSKKEARKM